MERLRVALERPEQTVNRVIFSSRTLPIVRIAQGMGIFDAFAAASNKPLTLYQLDEQTQGDKIMHLQARNYITPDDAYDAPHQFANNTKKHYFEWLAKKRKDSGPSTQPCHCLDMMTTINGSTSSRCKIDLAHHPAPSWTSEAGLDTTLPD